MHCPINNPDTASPEWKALVKSVGGNLEKAMIIFDENNYKYPQYIVNAVAGETSLSTEEASTSFFADKGITPNSTTSSEKDLQFLSQKEQLLAKSKSILAKKLKTLSHLAIKNENYKEGRDQLDKLLKQMDRLEADRALISFIKTAEKMTANAQKWMDKITSKEEEPTLEALRGIYDYVASFNILDTLTEDMIDDPELVKELEVLSKLAGRRREIKTQYITHAKKTLSKLFAPDFKKIEALYKEEAEKLFNKSRRTKLIKEGMSSTQLAEHKRDFIKMWLEINAEKMKLDTEKYVENMLNQTTDIGVATAWVVNPKDIGHDLIGAALLELEKEEFIVRNKTISVTDQADTLYNNFIKFVGKNGNPKTQYAILTDYVVNPLGEEVPVIINSESPGWAKFKATYEGTPVMELQEFLIKLADEKSKSVGKGLSLGYELPRINKSTIERVLDNGLLHAIKEGTIDKFRVRSEDTEFGQIDKELEEQASLETINVITNEAGKERETIPLHYRAPITMEERSFDIITTTILDYHNSLSFESKAKNGVMLEALKDVIGEADIIKRTDGAKLIKIDQEGMEVTVKGEGSNLQQTVDSILRHKIYGISIEGDPNLAKKMQTIAGWTSFIGLAANWISGGANLLHGTTVSWIDSVGKNTGYYDAKDRAKAALAYDSDLLHITGDVGQRVPSSKTNLLSRHLNAFSDFSPVDKQFVENNRIKRLANTNTLMFFNTAGEHVTQSIVMYSVLEAIKVKGVDGNYLDKNFNSTTDRELAISLNDAYTVVEGKLILNPKVASTDKTTGVTENDIFQISQLIRRANRDLYGNYDSGNKSRAQRHVLGALAFQMRGWLVPGFQKRWKGIGNFRKDPQDIRLHQRYYNAETGRFEEGTYTVAVKFMYRMLKDVKALKINNVPEIWNELTDEEKANFKKAVLEIGLAVTALLIANAFRDGDEPEDIYIALAARRLYSELLSFSNPKEAVRTFKNPVMALNTIDNSLDLLFQTFSPTEQYETGKNAGEYKIVKRLENLVPIWKQVDRDAKDALLFLER